MNAGYNIIYADPPWQYKDKSKSHGGGAESHYPCMSIDEICELPVAEMCADNCVLFLWVTWPMLYESRKVVEAWGFVYKTCAFMWVKTNKRANPDQGLFFPCDSFDDFMGMGRWTRANSEFCLLATKGKPKRVSACVRQIIYAPVAAHSAKPAQTRKRIVELMGDVPRVELFARQRAEGWDSWGNEVESDLEIAGRR